METRLPTERILMQELTLFQIDFPIALQMWRQHDLDDDIRQILFVWVMARTFRNHGFPCCTCKTVIPMVRYFEDEKLGNM